MASSTVNSLEVINITRFLLLLDADADPRNGISIGAAVSTAASGWTAVDFSSASFETDVNNIVSDVNTAYSSAVSLPSQAYAQNHIQYTYGCLSSGVYVGDYEGDDTGNAIVWVDSILYDPVLLGTFDPLMGVAYGAFFNGSAPSGVWSSIGQGLTFDDAKTLAIGDANGALQLAGNLSGFTGVTGGTWVNNANGDTGTYDLTRLAGDAAAVFRISGYYTLTLGAEDVLGALAIDVMPDASVVGQLSTNEGVVTNLTGTLTNTDMVLSGGGYAFALVFDPDGSDVNNDDLLGDIPGVTGDVTLGGDTGSVFGTSCVLNYNAGLVGGGFEPDVVPDDNVSNINYTNLTGLEGVYQGSIARTAECDAQDDINYFVVEPDGTVRYFDYMDDNCNEGNACYTEPSAPNDTPSLIRAASGGGLEANYNGVGSTWYNISFAKGVNYSGVSYQTTSTIPGGFAADTEQPLGIKTRDVTLASIEANICPVE